MAVGMMLFRIDPTGTVSIPVSVDAAGDATRTCVGAASLVLAVLSW